MNFPTTPDDYRIFPIGIVRSSLRRREECPLQGEEDGPDAWLEIDPTFAEGLSGIRIGSELLLLTWLHQARRDILQVHPRGNPDTPLRGVFATRSPNRPNPVGIHRVTVLELADPLRIRVAPLEVLDSTPLVDIKPALS